MVLILQDEGIQLLVVIFVDRANEHQQGGVENCQKCIIDRGGGRQHQGLVLMQNVRT